MERINIFIRSLKAFLQKWIQLTTCVASVGLEKRWMCVQRVMPQLPIPLQSAGLGTVWWERSAVDHAVRFPSPLRRCCPREKVSTTDNMCGIPRSRETLDVRPKSFASAVDSSLVCRPRLGLSKYRPWPCSTFPLSTPPMLYKGKPVASIAWHWRHRKSCHNEVAYNIGRS